MFPKYISYVFIENVQLLTFLFILHIIYLFYEPVYEEFSIHVLIYEFIVISSPCIFNFDIII